MQRQSSPTHEDDIKSIKRQYATSSDEEILSRDPFERHAYSTSVKVVMALTFDIGKSDFN